jgi:hypothetical protein
VVTAPAVTHTVSPATISLGVGEQTTFAASVGGSANQAVIWSVAEGAAGGTVSASGLYTAPAIPGTYHVVATSSADPTKSASSTVTVAAPQPVLATSTAWIAFGGLSGGTAPPAQVIAISNGGTGSLVQPSLSVSYNVGATGWLSASIGGTAPPYSLTLAPIGPLPAEGYHQAYVSLTSPGATGSPLQVGVILWVTPTARTVTVTNRTHFQPEVGSPAVVNVTGSKMNAVLHNPTAGPGVTMPIPGIDNGDGTYTIHGVPAGPFLLDWGVGFYEVSASAIDISAYSGYRPGVVVAKASTPVTIALAGLLPWDPLADRLQIFANDTYVWNWFSGMSLGSGSTSTPGELINWRNTFGGLLQPADRFWAGQLRSTGVADTVSGLPYTYYQNVAGGFVSGQTVVDGVPSSFPVSLLPPAGTAISNVDWPVTQFEAALPSLVKSGYGTHSYTLHASAAPVTPIYYNGGTMDLIELSVGSGSPDVRAQMPYGAVAPTSYFVREWCSFDDTVDRLAVGATTPLSLAVSSWLSRAAQSGVRAAPLVGEVSSPTIAGLDARVSHQGVGTGPLVSWGPPALGTADYYVVLVIELGATAGTTQQTRTVLFRTSTTAVQLPDWLLQPGKTYVVKITAHHMPGYVEAAPNTYRVPHGYADFLSAEFTP